MKTFLPLFALLFVGLAALFYLVMGLLDTAGLLLLAPAAVALLITMLMIQNDRLDRIERKLDRLAEEKPKD